MNKEFNSNNYQDHQHQEGQQQNISHNRQDGVNNPPSLDQNQQTESDKESNSEGNRNEKGSEGQKRQGNSSI